MSTKLKSYRVTVAVYEEGREGVVARVPVHIEAVDVETARQVAEAMVRGIPPLSMDSPARSFEVVLTEDQERFWGLFSVPVPAGE